MPIDLTASLVLITSKTRAENFGTGFIIEQTANSTRVLTCRHVIIGPRSVDGAENATIFFSPDYTVQFLKIDDKEIIGAEEVEDFAVLEITPPLDGTALSLTEDPAGVKVRLEGFSKQGQAVQQTPLDGTIYKRSIQYSMKTGLSVPAKSIDLDLRNELHPGYSGSPVLNGESNAVWGMIAGMMPDGSKGLSYEVSHLQKLWPGSKRLFIEEKVMILHGAGDEQVARQLEVELRNHLSSLIGLHEWTGTATDWLMLSRCKTLVMIWSTVLQATARDLTELLQRRLLAKKRDVPISMKSSPPRDSLEAVLATNVWCTYESKDSVGRIVQAITGSNPFATPPPPPPIAPDPRQMPEIARRFRRGSVTVVVGGGQSPEWDISNDLMADLKLPEAYSYLPLDIAGSYYSFGTSLPELDRKLEARCSSPSHWQLCKDLCEVLRKESKKPEKRTIISAQPQLVVTTNFDLTLERCLLSAGLPFLRVVNDRSGRCVYRADYSTAVAAQFAGTVPEGIDMLDVPVPQIRVQDQLEDRMTGLIQNPIQTLSLGDAKLVLYKLVGSAEIDYSTILTSEQIYSNIPHLRSGKQTPVAILSILNTTDTLFLGYGHLDQSFRVIQQLLPTIFGDGPRYFVQARPKDAEPDPLRSLEAKIWPGLVEQRLIDAQVRATTIDVDPSDFVGRLSTILTGQRL